MQSTIQKQIPHHPYNLDKKKHQAYNLAIHVKNLLGTKYYPEESKHHVHTAF
ncbi:MAG: hypothetical protein OEX01_01535 [Candidatus Bathyarchaeota archaeon]|nr:hypothetical protein [Candidatus Bathyarchaeota archaeon]